MDGVGQNTGSGHGALSDRAPGLEYLTTQVVGYVEAAGQWKYDGGRETRLIVNRQEGTLTFEQD